MAKTKLIKSFVHNLADSYMGTLGWVEGDYKSTWIYRSAIESGIGRIVIDVRNSAIEPLGLKYENILKKSLQGLNEHFNSMLATQKIEENYVSELGFIFEIPEFSQKNLHVICRAFAKDIKGKEHVASPIENKYGYEVVST